MSKKVLVISTSLLSLMTAIRNTGTDFWRRGGGTAKEWEL